jgi:hypothetical protein
MKRFLTYIYISLIPCFLWAQPNVTFKGTVENGSNENAPMANIDVNLQHIVGGTGAPIIIQQKKTNSAGNFSFTLSNVDSNSIYVAAAKYSSVTYYSETAQFKNMARQADKKLVVYDTTKSTDYISSYMHHLFLDDDGGSIIVRETTVLENAGQATIVGSAHEHGIGDACLKFQLPLGAQNFTPSRNNKGVELIRSGDFVFDKGVFVPGNKQISYVYQLPWRKNSTTVYLDVPYGAKSFDIYLNNPNMHISSPQLVDHGPFNIRGKQYTRLGTSNVTPGSRLEFTIQRDFAVDQKPGPIILITSLLLVLATLYAIAQKSETVKPKTGHNRNKLEKRKTELLKSIAELDSELSQKPHSAKQEKRDELYKELHSIALELASKNSQAQSRKKK